MHAGCRACGARAARMLQRWRAVARWHVGGGSILHAVGSEGTGWKSGPETRLDAAVFGLSGLSRATWNAQVTREQCRWAHRFRPWPPPLES